MWRTWAVILADGGMISAEDIDGGNQQRKEKPLEEVQTLDGHVIETTGLIKMDFLGLKTLSEMKEACKVIKQTTGDDAHRNAEDLGDVIHLLLQRSFLIFGGGEHVGDLADLRIHTGAGHDCAAGALRHGSAVEDHVGAVAQRLGFGECVRLQPTSC